MSLQSILFKSNYNIEFEIDGHKFLTRQPTFRDIIELGVKQTTSTPNLKQVLKDNIGVLSKIIISVDGKKPENAKDTEEFLYNLQQSHIFEITRKAGLNNIDLELEEELKGLSQNHDLNSKLEIIFELGGVPTEKRFLDMTLEQWAVLARFNLNRQMDKMEEVMGYIDYLASLVSPHPKETMKAIESRRKETLKRKRARGEIIDDSEFKLFKKDHRNTTFFDAIKEEGGEEALSGLKEFFGEDAGNTDSVEMYEPDATDIDYFEKAILEQQNEGKPSEEELKRADMDSIEF